MAIKNKLLFGQLRNFVLHARDLVQPPPGLVCGCNVSNVLCCIVFRSSCISDLDLVGIHPISLRLLLYVCYTRTNFYRKKKKGWEQHLNLELTPKCATPIQVTLVSEG